MPDNLGQWVKHSEWKLLSYQDTPDQSRKRQLTRWRFGHSNLVTHE